MIYSERRMAGALIFIGVTQFVVGMIVSEALYSGYSVSENYISDLGVGPSSIIFNSSVFILGLLLFVGTYFFQRAFGEYKVLTLLLILTSIGTMGVGVFTEHFGVIHEIVSGIAFLFSGSSAIFSVICSHIHRSKLLKMPFSIISVILGLICLGALILFASKIDLNLGMGGMERMIAYPVLIWGAGFGGYLVAYSQDSTDHKSP